MSFFNQVLLAQNAKGVLESLVGRSKQRLVATFPDSTKSQTTVFDIMQSFAYKQSVRITENPIEQGVSINDHRIQQPLQLQIRVGVSNIIDPLSAASLLDAGSVIQSLALQIVGSKIANSRIEATYKQLQNAMYNSDVFDLDTPMGLIKNLIITDIENENDDESITTFEGLITMKEVLYFDNINNALTEVSGINARDVIVRAILSPFQ